MLHLQVVSVARVDADVEDSSSLTPDSVTLGGTYRAFSRESFNGIRDRIEEVIIHTHTHESFVKYVV